MRNLIVIPARWGSTRFPGKPLAVVAGQSLISRTVDLARRAIYGTGDTDIVVATDHRRIADVVEALGVDVVMTDPALASGSARALAAVRLRSVSPTAIVNLQGDAPFLPVKAITAVIAALTAGAAVATPVVELDWASLDRLREHKATSPFSGTTCLVGSNGDAIWFSKQIIPAIRDEERLRLSGARCPVLRHLGLYGYRLDSLVAFEQAPPSRYEELEGLEQLRFIAIGTPVRVVTIEPESWSMGGIDTPADVLLAESLIAAHGDPYRQ